MNTALIVRLAAKDWYLSRLPLTCVALAGVVSIVMILQRDAMGFAGLLIALISLIMLSVIIPLTTIVNERKQHNLAFVMSLPVSPRDYTASKVLGNLSAFAALWLPIAGVVLGLLARDGSRGVLPLAVVAALMPLMAFSLLMSVAIVSESEFWSMLTMGATNISYSFWWVLFNRIPSLRDDMRGPEAVWSPVVLTIIAVQLGVCVLAFTLTFILQSRKRSFI